RDIKCWLEAYSINSNCNGMNGTKGWLNGFEDFLRILQIKKLDSFPTVPAFLTSSSMCICVCCATNIRDIKCWLGFIR
ncbi:MAG: hypothetical protein ACPGVB_15970, partial [Chitinophagales bacterium]